MHYALYHQQWKFRFNCQKIINVEPRSRSTVLHPILMLLVSDLFQENPSSSSQNYNTLKAELSFEFFYFICLL
jgi:hypothetical protein